MKKYRVAIVISILVLIIGYIVDHYFNPYTKRISWLENEIPKYHLLERKDSIDTKIKETFSTHGFVYMTVLDSQKITIGVSRNGLYEKSFIGDFVQIGDSLHKESGSDTLYIYRNNENYYFILGKIINEN